MLAAEPAALLSAGIKTPDSRKDLMLLIRNNDDAEGERRMMGSIRRPGFLRLDTSAIDEDKAADGAAMGPPVRALVRPRKTSACFRT